MEELKNCPFCGGKAKIFNIYASGFIPKCLNSYYLDSCNCSLGEYETKEQAIKAWNTRAEKE